MPVPFFLRRPGLCALGIILSCTLARLWIASSGQLDLAQDEAQYWDWSRRLQPGYYSKGPLIAWIIALWTGVFGHTELGVRFGAVLNSLAVQGLIYAWLGILLRRPGLALATLLIANSSPMFIVGGVLMTTDNPLLLCWTGGLACLTGLTGRPGACWPLWGLALCACLGVLSKFTMLAFLPPALAYCWLLRRRGTLRARAWRLAVLALSGGALLGLAPSLAWNAGNDFVTFRHLAGLAGLGAASADPAPLLRPDRVPEFLGSQAALALPWWLALMLWQGARLARSCLSHLRGQGAGDEASRLRLLLCLQFWPLWLFFVLWSFHSRVYPNWPAMSYVAGFVLAALGADEIRMRRRGILKACAAASLIAGLAVHGQAGLTRLLPLPEFLDPTLRLKGWSDLGRELDSLRQAMPRPEEVFFFSDSYGVAAELAFYIPGRPVVFCADFGRRLNQYDFWPDPNGRIPAGRDPGPETPGSRSGWDALYVARAPLRAIPRQLRDMFASLPDRPSAYPSLHRGKPGRTFGFLPAYGFTGRWPRSGRERY
ncbi:MAG: glycosyltransferase family 39 protein [Desulfovibrio sp.]|jgi:hypothetical protein|nr:glycosyltransferase family 39 protein [Desulfovibrio sp.]